MGNWNTLFGRQMDEQLRALKRDQHTEQQKDPADPGSKTIGTLLRKGMPWAMAASALILLILLFGGQFLPAAKVQVESVVTLPTGGKTAGSTGIGESTGKRNPYAAAVLLQASGWFEADPYPYRATALASGVVETVYALEGQKVKAGEPIASLISEDAELRLRMAEAALGGARAALSATQSEYNLSLARSESMRRQIDVVKARREELLDLANRAEELGPEVLAPQEIIQSRLRLSTQEQAIAAGEAQLREREIESEQLQSQLQVRQGQVVESEVRVSEAALEFERMVIRAPVDGIIQKLMVTPGQKKVLMADHPESATVALLFQPEFMQARIDVPIADASALVIGQAVLLESEFLRGEALRGYIQRIVGEADLQRNTLQVKVRIGNPPPGLRPDILCRAKFLDAQVGEIESGIEGELVRNSGGTRRLVVMVPRTALTEREGRMAKTWVVDESNRRVERRELQLSGEEEDGYLGVIEGLSPGDRVVVNPSSDLKDGHRIDY